MKKQVPNREIQFLIPIVLLLFFPMISASESSETASPIQSLIYRLSRDGFDPEFLSKLLMDSRSEPNPERMTLSLGSRETKELYEQFLSPESISLARTFLRQNPKLLRRMEDQFHVEMEVVSAILLVESRFGENIGKYRVIPTLASMALTDSPENLRRNFQALNKMDPELSFEWLEVLSKRRADWAYQELKCFLRIILNERVDPLEVYGSYAGALGMPQFIPSSYLAYAVSKKNLESWLLNKEEAIFSIGNYLKSHGWKKKLSIDKKRRVLWRYNHSDPYVETILQISQKLKPK